MNFLFIVKQQDSKNSENQTIQHQSDNGLKPKHPDRQMTNLRDLEDSLNVPAESLHNSGLKTIVNLDKQSIV